MAGMRVKWDVDGKGEAAWTGGERYQGETPPKGSYVARIKRITMHKIKSEGENKNKPRLSVLLEIVGGKGADGVDDREYQYYGAPVWDGVNIIKAQAGRANAFIHALTDGSDEQKRAIENKFWPPNMDVRAEKVARRDDKPDEIHIKSIGPYKVNSPNGELLVRIVTKMGKDINTGAARAEVSEYLPYLGEKPKPAKPVDAEDDDEELLDATDDDVDGLPDDDDDEFIADDDDDDDDDSGDTAF